MAQGKAISIRAVNPQLPTMAQHLYPNGLTPALFLSRTAHHFLDAEL